MESDRDQPIRIQADHAHLDDKRGVATYTGDVIITQGSFMLKGNTVTVTRASDGGIGVITGTGNLAYFEVQVNARRPDKAKGWGVTIRYEAQKDMISVTDRAKVEMEGTTSEGKEVVVNLKTMVPTVADAPNPNRTRINVVITPR
ncbi:lipopolysaccharide transport periplasmic protein LptA [Streptomyces sp. NPDC057910]|uniref:lipopolysaccharide transport periplasmic protein LptA n=1 Tax=Streptomyces sp. NPDC057910 TaxID=3346278 RepID=UPI0036EAC734